MSESLARIRYEFEGWADGSAAPNRPVTCSELASTLSYLLEDLPKNYVLIVDIFRLEKGWRVIGFRLIGKRILDVIFGDYGGNEEPTIVTRRRTERIFKNLDTLVGEFLSATPGNADLTFRVFDQPRLEAAIRQWERRTLERSIRERGAS